MRRQWLGILSPALALPTRPGLLWVGLVFSIFLAAAPAHACTSPVSVCARASDGAFHLIRGGVGAPVLFDDAADPAVRNAALALRRDLERVGGRPAAERESASPPGVVIVGALGQDARIDRLVGTGAIDASDLPGQWEAYRQIVVENPFPGTGRALVIVGADRRGAVFGVYDLSEKIGVSPWHYFADVPVRRQPDLFVTAGARRDQPRVKYRGFFINDEDPAFATWARKRFGGINSKMYAHVFELLLRMKGNYLWPAMWAPKAFNDDDPQNMVLADAMGVVMGSSHHEPLTRAQHEWHRNQDKGVTGGKWDYSSNAENLRKFWRGGIERMMSKPGGKGYESLVTIGMRGDGDEAMAEGTAIPLLERIVADQRRIIAEVTGRPAAETPQMWALYKEVQDYYDHGMQVPDDVTLLFADDNWGQIRRLPAIGAPPRKGGYGVYYHFDYVGAPRNYKWLNTVQIEKTWQQMDLAWRRGARDIWIVNVGDIKPVEFPLSFFMKQAWDPEAMTLEALARYPEDWARATFGPEKAAEIGALVTRYGQLAARRKPELIDASSFRLGAGPDGERLDGGEFGAITEEWASLEFEARQLAAFVPRDARDAWFQLVEHPISAMANLHSLYYSVAWNRRLAAAKDPRANSFADRAEAAFARDRELAARYHSLNGGKWDGMMLQTHIGYTSWQQPERDIMPEVKRVASAAPPLAVLIAAPSASLAPVPGVVAVEAPHFTRAVGGKGLAWQVIPHLGRTLGAVAALPQGRPPTSEADGVRLEYEVDLAQAGDAIVRLYLVPTLDVSGKNRLSFGVSIDDGKMRTVTDSLVPAPTSTTTQEQRDWNKAVEDNARMIELKFPRLAAGRHRIHFWRLDDNVVLQKLVVATRPIPPSYLGPAPVRAAAR